MTKEATIWQCFCLKRLSYETEVCPECGRHRDFVLEKRASAHSSPARPPSTRASERSGPTGNDHKGGSETPFPEGPGVGVEEPEEPEARPRARPALRRGRGVKQRGRLRRLNRKWGRRPLRWAVNVALLLAIYWVTTSVANYLRQPTLQMLQSPIAGPLAVAVEQVRPQPIASKVTYTGSVSPLQEVTVYPRVQGWIEDFKLYEGDTIRKGDVIARLDQAELRAVVANARERVAAGEQHLAEVEANIGVHRAGILEAEAALAREEANVVFWEREFRRVEALFKRGAVAEFDLDNARNQLAAARAKRDAQRAALQSHRGRLRATQQGLKRTAAMLEARKAELARRSTVLGYTEVLAPISGVVAKRHVYAGVLVKPGAPIVDIADVSKVRVQARVAEEDLPRVKAGTPAVVRLPELPEPYNRFRTKVSTVFPKLDPVTRTATVEMLLDNPEGRIKVDMYAVVDLIPDSREKALTVPRRAVVEVEGKPTVFVARGEEAVEKPVKLGMVGGDRVEILKGVQEGDLVVYEGNRALVDGQEVSVVSRR